MGDTWWNGLYPFIDYSTGGSIDGTIRATEANLANAKISDKTVIVPGHGPVGDKAQLGKCREMLVTIRDHVAVLKKQGKSLQEVVSARPTKAFDPEWATSLIGPDFFTALVYKGV